MKKRAVFIALIPVIITGVYLGVSKKERENLPGTISQSATQTNISNPAAVIAPSTTKFNMDLSKTIKLMAVQMNQRGSGTTAFEQDLEGVIAALSPKDGLLLLQTALDQSKSNNERFLAAYMMGKRANEFVSELAKLASSNNSVLISQPDAHTAGLVKKSFEVSLRIEALKGLDSVAKNRGQELVSVFKTIQEQSRSTTVQRIARIGYVGAARNEPLVEKYIESKLQAVVK